LYKKHHLLIIIAAFALISISVRAQQFDFRPLGIQPPGECYQVLQDHKGYIWFSTDKGLYKYNGSNLKHFSVNDGLPDNAIFKLFEDSKGRLLLTSLSGIVGYVSNDSIIIPGFNKQLSKFLNHGRETIFELYEDSSHILWISSNHGYYKTLKAFDYSEIIPVLLVQDSSRYEVRVFGNKKTMLAFQYLIKSRITKHSITVDIAINRNGFINSIHPTIPENDHLASFGNTLILKNGNILVSLPNHLFIITPNGHFVHKVFKDRVQFLYLDKTGGIWIGFHKLGVAYYNDSSLETEPVWSLKGYSVSSITEDNEGGIWASTLEKGIFYSPSKVIIDYSNQPELNKKISSLSVIGDNIFVNDYTNIFHVINGSIDKPISLPAENDPEGINNFLSFSKTVYMATTVCLFQTDTSLKRWAEISYTYTGLKRHAVIYQLSFSPSHKIYAINLAYLMTLEGDSVKIIDSLPARGRCITVTRQGEIFVGCINGLYKYENHKFKYLGEENKVFTSKVNALKEDSDGNLWVLTMTAGAAIYKNGKILSIISMETGLPSNNCNDVAFDKNKITWLGTDNGVCKIHADKIPAIEVFNSDYGLISDEITKLALHNNELWIGTGNGLCMMNTSLASKNKVPPPIYIASLFVNDSLISPSRVSFPYKLNNFRFQLNGLTFKSDKSHFLYRLTGLDTNWHSTDYFEISFYNLTPGTYQFEAKALNSDGIPSEKAATFFFTIEKPFWLRWWFIFIEILLGGLIIYLFIRSRLVVVHKKEEEKTRINKMLAEYQLTALRMQMNPHFIFNAINSIQHYVLQNNAELAYDYLTKFAHLIRMMLNNAQEKSLSLQHELEMLSLYVDLEKLRFDKGFEFTLTLDENIETDQIYIPAMLIQPYVENAIWHGLMNLKGIRPGKLEVIIKEIPGAIKIIIQDNGVGRKIAKELRKRSTHKSIGMELNNKRLALLSSLPENEKASITILDLFDENNEPVGTVVEINLTNVEF
jgi:hypothetical protein